MIRFGNTERLDRAALQCAGAGAVCTGLAVLASAVVGGSADWVRWIGPAALIAVVAPSWKDRLRALVYGGAAVLGYAAFASYTVFADLIAGGLIGFGLTSAVTRAEGAEAGDQHHTAKMAGTIVLAAAAWPLAVEALRSAAEYAQTQNAVPPFIVQTASGGVLGLLMGLTAAPLFLSSLGDPVAEALKSMQPTLDAELRALVFRIAETRARALKLMQQSRATTPARNETWRSLNAVALTAIELTNRFAAVDRVLSRVPMPDLEQRLTAARTQLAETTDAGVKRDLERTLSALEEQRQQVERLIQGRARLVARLQSELALLEKTEMSFALLASGDAALAGIQLETIGSGLVQQAHELEAEGSALQEMLTVSPRQAMQKLTQ